MHAERTATSERRPTGRGPVDARRTLRIGTALGVVAAGFMASCQMFDSSPASPAQGGSVSTAEAAKARSSEDLQAALFGFADTYISLVSQSADNLMAMDRTPVRRVRAIRAKLDGAQDVVEIVTGPNPTVALLDLAVMVTLQHDVWNDYWKKAVFNDDTAYNYNDTMERLHREVWRLVGQNLSEADAAALRVLAQDIRERFIHQVFITSVRASDVTRSEDPREAVKAPPSLLALFGLDPLAGLSPAISEVTKTRLLAERLFFYSQKLPTLVQWRSQLAMAEVMTYPEAQQTMANIDAGVDSAVKFNEILQTFPDVLAQQRAIAVEEVSRAASEQVDRAGALVASERAAVLDGLAKERTALLEAFDDRHAQAKEVLTELRGSIEAARDLTESVNQTLVQVRELTASDPSAPPAAPGRPFDVREYQQAIESATGAIKELNAAVAGARDLMNSPEWQQTRRSVEGVADDLEGRAIRLIGIAGLVLGVSLFVSLSGAALVRRRLARTA